MKKTLLAVVCATALASVFHTGVAGQQAGVNTPVLPGVPANPDDPLALHMSDLVMNRQVEPEIVVSTRNPLHMLAFFNDYRSVVLSNDQGIGGSLLARSGWIGRFLARFLGLEPLEGKPIVAAAEATTGMARSYDGGVTWTGALVPGSPDDPSPAASQSPAWGLDAMTDPRAVSAPCGRAYLFNVAFTRGGASKLMVTRYEDKNDEDGGDTWHMLGQSVIETGQNAPGHFHDLPYAAVDIARTPGAGACDHVLYLAWARFSGDELASKIMFAKSVDGGITWQQKFIKSTNKTDQGLVMTVDPRSGTPATGGGGKLYIGWRVFGTADNPAAMWLTTSSDFGATFGKAIPITGTAMYPYDQPSLPSTAVTPAALAFRSNAFMTLQSVPHLTDATRSTLFAAWQERVNVLGCPGPECGKPSPTGDPRIVVTRSTDGGLTWVDPLGVPGRRAVDFGGRDLPNSPDFPKPGFGYIPVARASGAQVMPRLSFGGGRLALGYLEGRGPLTAIPGTAGLAAGMYRQFDARLALLDPVTGGLLGTNQVSRYPVQVGATLIDGEQDTDILMLRQDPIVRAISDKGNTPGSGGGTTPFFGDYLTVVPTSTFVFDRTTGRWRWAIAPGDVPFKGFHMVFPDSRHVIPPAFTTPEEQVAVWPLYDPPGTNAPSCLNPGSRNHDVMHTLVDAGVPVNSIASYKELGVIARTFPVTVTNTQGQTRYFRAELQPADVASFHQFQDVNAISIEILPYSSSTRAVTVSSPTPTTSVTVSVSELMLTNCGSNAPPSLETCTAVPKPGGDSGTVTLNLDPTNEQNVEPTATETHNPLVTNPLVTNPLVTNPLVTNPLVTNPLVTNPLVTNNTAANPLVTNPLVTNPLVTNPLVTNATVHDIIDATWKVTNLGTDGTAYLTQVALANAAALEGNYVFHLFIYRVAAAAGLDGCTTTNLNQDQLISSIPNPFSNPLVTNPLVTNPLVTNPLVTNPLVTNPLVTNSTFASAPADVPVEGNERTMAQAAVSSDDGTLHDDYRDQVFVTVRAYQIVPDSALTAATTYDPIAAPPTIAVISQTTNTIDGVVDPVEELPGSFGSAADLAITTYTPAAPPLTVVQGGVVTLAAHTISNLGDGPANAPAGSFRNGFYLSPDPALDPATDRLLATNFNSSASLPAGGEFAWTPKTLIIPADVAPGTYYVGFYTDDQGQVIERDELNNYISEPVTVVTAPPVGLLQFVTQPGDVTVNQSMLPAVQVAARDSSGALLPGIQIDLAFGSNPGDAGLSGAPQTTNAFGIATFSNLRVTNSGAGYTLSASVGAVAAASDPFKVFGIGLAGDVCSAPSFAGSSTAVGTNPGAIATGDFNGDGHTDLAVANRGSNDVSVLLGNALGGFGTAVQYTTGTESGPIAIVAADLTGDGRTDLATANDGTNTAALLAGNGDGTFDLPQQLSIFGFDVLAVGAGDVDGDGDMDLVVAADSSGVAFDGVLSIFHGNGDGGVSGPTAIGVGVNPVDVLVMDLNLDGLADITVVHEAERAPVIDGAVSVLIATLGGGFIRVLDVATTAEPRAMAPGDFDGDGVVDLAVVRENGVDVFQGNGPAFALAATIPLPADAREVTVSDFNGDGIADIVATTAGGLETILRTGAPGFLFSPPVHSDPNPEPRGVASGDWNADGRADLVVANGGPTNTATVLVNNCASLVVINTNDSGPGSLRQALLNANASASTPTVAFGIPGPGPHTIVPLSALPPVTRPMQIDGTTQPGFSGVPLIVLNGASAGAVSGLRLEAGNTVVRGLTINGFSGAGVDIFGAGGNLIQGNYIGLNAAGTAAVPNGTGVSMTSSLNNLIGGATAAERNVISGNLSAGVIATGGTDFPGNEVSGNYIGTNAAGTGAVGNGLWGVQMLTPASRIGAVGRGNVISGNGNGGIVLLQDDNVNGVIEANRIGTNAAGTAAIPNNGSGVAISDAEFSRIGGVAPGAGNLISGNTGAGIQLSGDASGTIVQGNLIGTNAAGTAPLGNGSGGVIISGSFGTELGGTTAAARNLISGNQADGVFLSDSRTSKIHGNFIGVSATGNIALPNTGDGVHLAAGSDSNTIGTLDGTGRNVISGNGRNGIWIQEGSSNAVFGNYIGTNAAGSGAVGNAQAGIAISTGPNTVGGPGTASNLISGNGAGIFLLPGSNGNQVQGNFIGTNATGVGRVPNGEGIRIEGAAATGIGGTGPGEGNLISGNGTGVAIVAGGNNNLAQNNLIGTNAAGTGSLFNTVGVSIDGNENAVLGGVIAFNTGAGAVVLGGIGNNIAASIHTNGGLGIDLGGDGVTPNDAGDFDSGPNSLQNFPVIATAVAAGGGTNVTGTAFGTDSNTVRLVFYASASCDASGNGEGARMIGQTTVTLDISGTAPFSVTVGPTAPGEVVTATAFDNNASVSEFSACTIVVGG